MGDKSAHPDRSAGVCPLLFLGGSELRDRCQDAGRRPGLASAHRRFGDASGAPAAAGEVVILGHDPEVGDLVAEGCCGGLPASAPNGRSCPGWTSGGDDELPLELPSRLVERHATTYELIDDLVQAPVEILFRQVLTLE